MYLHTYLLGMNNGIDICAHAAQVCWDSALPKDRQGMAEYVGRRAKTGHTSVMEHSNLVAMLTMDDDYDDDLIEFLSVNNYLHTAYGCGEFFRYLIIGGSWRAYSDIFLTATKEQLEDNLVIKAIRQFVTRYIPKYGFMDLIEAGVLSEAEFDANWDPIGYDDMVQQFNKVRNVAMEDFVVVSADSYDALRKNILDAIHQTDDGGNDSELFTNRDLMKFLTCTIDFLGASRTATHQIVRHRNGITQQSMRYVNYADAPFAAPYEFKPDRYDKDHKYPFEFGGQHFEMTQDELGKALCGIYAYLQDKDANGDNYMINEDARAFLPQNVECGHLYMTFNFYSMAKFLQLREDRHAQAEIRKFATEIGYWFRNHVFDVDEAYTTDGCFLVGCEDKVDDEGKINPAIYDLVKATSVDISPFSKSIGDSDQDTTKE